MEATDLYQSYCHVHDEFEYAKTVYIVCFECGHIYESKDKLLQDHKERYPEAGANCVHFCAHCVHDF